MKVFKPIITSLADSDKYKFTMCYVFFMFFTNIGAKYKFKNRSKINLLPYKDEIIRQVKQLCTLRFTEEELIGIKLRNPYFSVAYIEFLRNLQLNYDYLDIREKDGDLYIATKPGVPLIYTTWFEINLLTIIEGVYVRAEYPDIDYTEADEILTKKISDVKEMLGKGFKFTIADFITRRRVSKERQERVIIRMRDELPGCFVGTSNVHLAIKHNVLDIGTMAHEYLQVGQGLDDVNLKCFQKYMLQKWMDVFQGQLGIALTDVVGFDAFLRDFNLYFANHFSGCRHDSGDPFVWGDKLIAHYIKLGIDPMTKTAVFSDGVSFELMFRLINYFHGRIKISFGIGTNLVNDIGAWFKTLQMVMKIIECNGNPVAKISDSPGKGMCEKAWFEEHINRTFEIK